MKSSLLILSLFSVLLFTGIDAKSFQISSPQNKLSKEGKIDSLNNWVEKNIEKDINNALSNSLNALELSKEINYPLGEAQSMINLGWIYYRMDDYLQAIDYAFKGHQSIIPLNKPNLTIRSFFNIGAIYSEGSGQLELALEYFEEAYERSLDIQDRSMSGRALNNRAFILTQMGRYDEALQLITPFLADKKDDFLESYARRTLGDIQKVQGDTAKAINSYLIAYQILEKEQSYSTLTSCIIRLAELYLATGQNYKAKLYLDKGEIISENNHFREQLIKINQLNSNYYENLGNWKEALFYQKKYASMQDSVTNQINSKNMGRMEAKIDFDQRLNAINTEMALNEKLINEKLQQQIFRRNIFLAGFIIMLVLVTIVLFTSYRIRRSKYQAESANRAKSDFISSMSHEIRTPLNGVIGFSDLLNSTPLDANQKQYITLINQSAKSLMEIVNDILDFSKIEAGKLEIELSQTNIYELGIETVNLVAFQAHQRSIELILDIDEQIPKMVLADQVRIKQILINLLSNAVKFTKKGEITLKIERLGEELENFSKIRFTVSDTGKGIEPGNQEKIFSAFTQEDSSTTRKFGGTGLGLAICKKLLNMMGGKIYVESELNKGSRFWFEINFETLEEKQKEPALPIENLYALIVEKNQRHGKVIQENLSYLGASSDLALSQEEAEQLLRNSAPYNLMLVNHDIKEGNGAHFIQKLKSEMNLIPNDIKTILMHNAFVQNSRIPEHVDALLIKPYKKPDFLQILNKLFHPKDTKSTFDQNMANQEDLDQLKEISPSILIAEDNQVNMILTKKLLHSFIPKAVIMEAKNGKKVIDVYNENEVDIIFMDIQMPVLNGYEATEAIRKMEAKTGKHTPIIALTAGILNNERQKCLEAGLDDYTSKPMNKKDIGKILHQWLLEKIS
ncbi:response regulator [Echinicola marina]|uniref:ATP-binding protein n=1 Tax=Echinicola marina TaxID=2859768 RepID=UPI001CF64D86|nr:ATP-binding protein [Echinicola marina]UCS93073.1 response regulator [Echinicola marina]